MAVQGRFGTVSGHGTVTLAAQLPVNYRELAMTWNQMGMLGPVATAKRHRPLHQGIDHRDVDDKA